MTVCIAAICESGKNIVLASDRMYTAAAPMNLEFETDERKIEQLGTSCITLVSGNSAYASEILVETRSKLGGDTSADVSRVVGLVKENYSATRLRKCTEMTITPTLGSDFQAFLSKGGTLPNYLQAQPNVYQQLIMLSQQYNMGVDIIVAGIDKTGAYIALITNPGTVFWLDKLGYGAIGSGGIHSQMRLHLCAQVRSRQLTDTLHSVYEAKKAAEVAPGVGKVTDMAVIDRDKGIRDCGDAVMRELEQLHEKVTSKSTLDLTALKGAYDKG